MCYDLSLGSDWAHDIAQLESPANDNNNSNGTNNNSSGTNNSNNSNSNNNNNTTSNNTTTNTNDVKVNDKVNDDNVSRKVGERYRLYSLVLKLFQPRWRKGFHKKNKPFLHIVRIYHFQK